MNTPRHPFREEKDCFPQSVYMWLTLPRNDIFILDNGFLWLLPMEPTQPHPSAINDNNGECSTHVEPLAVKSFPVLKQFFHRSI